MKSIYLDHAATSPVHPEVVQEMLHIYEHHYGNPSSIHHVGRKARQLLDEARRNIAKQLGVSDHTLIFTSGGTEADNLAIIGYALANRHKGNHIITTAIEHHAVLHACEELEKYGFEVTYLPVSSHGQITAEQVEQALKEDTLLVTVMFGNNEVGTVQPITDISKILQKHQAVLHTDAVQACGLIDLNITELGVDFLSISAHKINGPKGVGLLYAKEGLKLQPALFGGEQERKKRAGTENVAGIVGFAKALELSYQNLPEKVEQYKSFSQRFFDILLESGLSFQFNGHQSERLPHIFNISFPDVNVESMLVNLDMEGIAASSGSACTAGSIDPSHVLVAMYPDQAAEYSSALRFSFGLGNTLEDIEYAATKTVEVVRRLQQDKPFII